MPRLRWVVVLLLALVVSACGDAQSPIRVPAPPAHAPPLTVGVIANTLGAGRKMGAAQRKVNGLGVHWIREEVDWPVAEPQPGIYRWSMFDRLFRTAAQHRLHVLPLILGSPGWTGSRPLELPADRSAFADFVAHLSRRYGPRGTFWRAHPRLNKRFAPRWFELWNEPYTTAYSTGGVDPARYAQLVVAATAAGRAANPRTRWLMAADLDYETADGGHRDWLNALYAAEPDLSRFFDGVAVHPYSYLSPAAGADAAPLNERFDRIAAIEHDLRQRGAGSKPMWITELGWSTCALRPACTSEHDQAQWLAQAFTLVRTRYAGFVRAMFVYHLDDFATNEDSREDHYGLLGVTGSQKPAWSVVREEAGFANR